MFDIVIGLFKAVFYLLFVVCWRLLLHCFLLFAVASCYCCLLFVVTCFLLSVVFCLLFVVVVC